MSIFIRGMEMPKNEPLLVKINPDGSVSTTAKNGYKKYEAIPVPPCGRLIDADALAEDLKRQCEEVFKIDAVSPDDFWITRKEAYNERLWKTWCESFFDYLQTRPTVIPAEEGE